MPKQTFKDLINYAINIINNDPTQLEELLKLSKNPKYISLLYTNSANNTIYWVNYFKNNELSFVDQHEKIRENKYINEKMKLNIDVWLNYIYNNPLNYYRLPYNVKKNRDIINIASKNKQLWIVHINNIHDYINAPIPIKQTQEVIIKLINYIKTFISENKKIEYFYLYNKNIIFRIITHEPSIINNLLTDNLIFNEILNDYYFLFNAIKINNKVIYYIKYKWFNKHFMTNVFKYYYDNDDIEFIKIMLERYFEIFEFLPIELKLSIYFIDDLVEQNYYILPTIINEYVKIIDTTNYPFALKKIKPVHSVDFIIKSQIKELFIRQSIKNKFVHLLITEEHKQTFFN